MNQYINALDEMIEEYSFDSARKYILEKARDKISSPPSDTQWIDVKEKKPKKNTDVLCYITTKEGWYCDVLMFDGLEFVEGDYALGVTHWQPLPLPPNN